jgi:hypothetical protein
VHVAHGDGLIQRLAGIEYETGIEAATPENQPVGQDEEMLDSGHGWKVYSDQSKLEFVTEPAVEVDALSTVVNHLLDTLDGMPTPFGGGLLGNVVNVGVPRRAYSVKPYQRPRITGVPQGTIGIPITKLFKFFELISHYSMGASKKLINEHGQKYAAGKKKAAASGLISHQTELQQFATDFEDERGRGAGAVDKDTAKLLGRLSSYVKRLSAPHAPNVPASELEKYKGVLEFVGLYAIEGTQLV